jgi:LmbE family N-acetylglucosaminyl deacetylase
MENILSGIKKVLVLGPHPDDMEFGCLGTVLKLMEQKTEIHYAVFSMCEKSVPAGMPAETIKKELISVCEELKIDSAHRHFFSYDVRTFPQFRQEILEQMVALNRELKPDLVFSAEQH